jgi:hypothetical protein
MSETMAVCGWANAKDADKERLRAPAGECGGAVFADFSNHGYNDLFLFRDDGPPLLYENQAAR